MTGDFWGELKYEGRGDASAAKAAAGLPHSKLGTEVEELAHAAEFFVTVVD